MKLIVIQGLEKLMHQILEQVASVDDFLRLREISGLSPRSRKAAEKALPRSL